MPDPVDVDGGTEVEVGLDGGGDLGEQRHPVFLVSAEIFFFLLFHPELKRGGGESSFG